ncbi:MAG: peptidoglycan -binding protein [Alphaproteobacteria bacterium]|jgi:chemotaxis protein MotB|nr:peptidoglycan -binding protein [Alphaproteobacteria bacterium]MDP7310737.1 peptidoglycan -binding protein [Alphaproteobacteria bacterium]MDP7468222.1 peptidoglycan -binding protein [Alphaproteobacteria bacterium]MEE1568420.1 peptidoglycan -binding protein [Alphaproteobacteria bacterium]|tara:strand:- start:4922 stop:6070 length:1149 start_codon:yes stop_codon:yes gene_type:complete
MTLTASSRRSRSPVNIWPGFVDALAALLIIVIFLLMVFVLSQFYLQNTLSGREKALDSLTQQVSELAELLSLERQANADLNLSIEQLSAQLQSSLGEKDRMETTIGELTSSLRESKQSVTSLIGDLEGTNQQMASLQERLIEEQQHNAEALADMESRHRESKSMLAQERELTRKQRDALDLLNQQIAAMRSQLVALNEALEAAEKKDEENQVKISNLGKRLNVALAGKVQELAKYRSEFFGRLREVLGERKDIRVVGDRFVFQSEVLFDSGSDALGLEGQVQLDRLAETLLEIAVTIPEGLDWILRIDGHTDLVPISNERFRSNWELSAARAISVVKFLVKAGIPANRLAATGFGEFSPLDPQKDEIAFRRNRRIEIKLTQH